jgi:hypothetical protein
LAFSRLIFEAPSLDSSFLGNFLSDFSYDFLPSDLKFDLSNFLGADL